MLSTTVLSRATLWVAEGGLKASLHRSVWEQVFLPVGRGTRDMAKVLVDGVFARLSEGMASLVLYVWLSSLAVLDEETLNLSWLSWAIVALVLLWIILTGSSSLRDCVPGDGRDHRTRLADS